MPQVSAVVHTYNEAEQIARCLESLAWADEIVLVDTYSTDKTVDIARQYTDRILFHEYRNSAETKNWAIPHARYEWLFFLDADEVVTPELIEEIGHTLEKDTYSGYFIDRQMIFWNRPLKSTFFNPNYQLRLFRKDAGLFEEKEVHAQVHLQGKSAYLEERILHYSYRNLSAYMVKLNRFTTFEARQMQKDQQHMGARDFPARTLLKSFMAFLRLYFKSKGYRDGRAGFVLAVLGAVYFFLKDAKYWEFSRIQGDLGSGPDRQ